MNADQDPMLGSAEEQQAYVAKIRQIMLDTVEETRAERRNTPPKEESAPTIIGTAGFGDGIRAVS